jgi:hypothetical protein
MCIMYYKYNVSIDEPVAWLYDLVAYISITAVNYRSFSAYDIHQLDVNVESLTNKTTERNVW